MQLDDLLKTDEKDYTKKQTNEAEVVNEEVESESETQLPRSVSEEETETANDLDGEITPDTEEPDSISDQSDEAAFDEIDSEFEKIPAPIAAKYRKQAKALKDKATKELEIQKLENKKLEEKLTSLYEKLYQNTQTPQPQPAPQPQIPDKDEDPLGYWEYKQAQTEQNVKAINQNLYVQQLANSFKQAEHNVQQKHPDYQEAKNYLVEMERNNLKLQYGNRINDVQTNQILENKVMQFIDNNMRQGQDPAEVIYKMALNAGYQLKQNASNNNRIAPKPNIKAISQNAERSRSASDGSGKSDSGKLTLNDYLKGNPLDTKDMLTPEEFTLMLKQQWVPKN